MDDALQVTRRLVEEVATSIDGSEGVELSFHDIEKAYPRVCRGALWDLLSRWGLRSVAFACNSDVARWYFLQGSGSWRDVFFVRFRTRAQRRLSFEPGPVQYLSCCCHDGF